MWRSITYALVLTLAIGALGGHADARSYDAGRIDPVLLQQVLAAPKGDYDVIVRSVPDAKKMRDDRASRAADEIRKAGGRPKHALGIVGGASARIAGDLLLALTLRPRVDYVFADAPLRAAWDPVADASKAATPGILAVNAPTAWSTYGATGRGIGVALLDSGVAAHPDLGNRVVAAIDFTAPCTATPCPTPTVSTTPLGDPGGHGTHVAGLVAGDGTSSSGAYTGVAPMANIVDVRVIDANGSSNTSLVLRGMQWTLNNRSTYNVKVLNLSLGAPVSRSYKLDPLATGAEVLNFAGITVVVSAGNSGPAGTTITSPANDPYVISVGAVDDAQTALTIDDTIADFSSRGRTAIDNVAKPDVAAPGRRMVSLRAAGSTLDTQYPERRVTAAGATEPAYFTLSGTSMSAPVVAGAVALMLERNPTLKPDQVKKRLKTNAVPLAGYDTLVQGAGRIDVARTLASIDATREYSSDRVSDAFAKDMRKYIQGQPLTWKDLTYHGGVDSMNITWENITWANITWDNITWENITWENLTWENITWENITWENITWESTNTLTTGALAGSGGSGWAPLN